MSKIGPFIVGGVVGALAALLYAPRTGEQTRALVSEKVNAVWGEAKDFGGTAGVNVSEAYKNAQKRGASVIQDVTSNAQEFAQTVQGRGQEIYNSATSKVQDIADQTAPTFTNADNDDLREKIQAARERIAAQVMKNAEEAKEASPVEAVAEGAAEAVETAADAVEDAAEAASDAAADAAEAVVEEKKDAAE